MEIYVPSSCVNGNGNGCTCVRNGDSYVELKLYLGTAKENLPL